MRNGLLSSGLRFVKIASLPNSRSVSPYRCMKRNFLSILLGSFVAGSALLHADPILLPDPFNVLNQSPLAADCFGCRPSMEKHGVDLTVQSVSDLFGNTTGGAATGTTYSGLLNIGLAADLQKSIGWEGASFKSTWCWIYGSGGNNISSDYIDNAMTVSSIAAYPSFRCYELWLQQNAFNDIVSLRAGLLGLDTEFLVSDTALLFVNSTFGPPALFSMNMPNGGPTFPDTTPGVRLALQPNSWLTLRTAFSQANPFQQQVNQNGFDWNFGPVFPERPRLVSGSSQGGGPRVLRWGRSHSVPRSPVPTTPASTASSTSNSSRCVTKKPMSRVARIRPRPRKRSLPMMRR